MLPFHPGLENRRNNMLNGVPAVLNAALTASNKTNMKSKLGH